MLNVRRFILTGAPGSGKTAILRHLQAQGFSIVEEAATDLIALRHAEGIDEPWMQPQFVSDVAELQMCRLEESSDATEAVQFHDRSVACTVALARYLGFPEPASLTQAVERILRNGVFQKTVFFVQPLGFIAPTAARRITLEESLRFGQMHEEAYRSYGFDLRPIEPGPIAERAAAVLDAVGAELERRSPAAGGAALRFHQR